MLYEVITNIFDRAPAGFLLFDQDGTILDCNAAMEQLFGVPRQSYVKANLLTNMSPGPPWPGWRHCCAPMAATTWLV